MIREICRFTKETFLKLPIILRLSLEDFRKRFIASSFGFLWSFVQPAITSIVLWVVFSVGFRSSNVKDVPFICWMLSGLVPWYYFSEALASASNSLLEYRFILKQMSFTPSIIPLVKIISSIFTHLIFVGIMVFVMLFNGMMPNLYWLQTLYYFMCMLIFILGLSWLTASIKVFFADIGELINVCLQIGMWFTPVLWNIEITSPDIQWIFKLNPLFYIVQGYRDSLIYKISIIQRCPSTAYFWGVTIIIVILGISVFSKLKRYFNDVI
ncbi:ABC transporter permease [Clostridium saccharobutylicum]|uniref:Transport permease protein n=1 Tax=Clostridium saccharobutylicum TaxID=169679 RepID=A0A1S8NJ67_CLOSA|nr:ABC transporter permease [Clostridium saccharobutylicum]OOM16516.1 teichoic acid translocation permease protein TagG [Clostridium saccharobutylicum]